MEMLRMRIRARRNVKLLFRKVMWNIIVGFGGMLGFNLDRLGTQMGMPMLLWLDQMMADK